MGRAAVGRAPGVSRLPRWPVAGSSAARFLYPVHVVDAHATYQTKALFYNLRRLSGQVILFGQQDATQYGIGWHDQPDRSDVKSVCGSHPALYGWDVAEVVNARRHGRPATSAFPAS